MDGFITLENERLKIKIADCPAARYNSSRFDWTGFVTEIQFDGKYSFDSVETLHPADPMADGGGLCNEFRVPHYAAQTPAGEKFLKPGVGLLTQREGSQEWQYNHRYEIEPFKISKLQGKDWILYHVEGKPWNGIHIHEYKLLRLLGSRITETITIDNVGEKPFSCIDYNHNFLAINHQSFGSDYYIDMPGWSEELMHSSITMGNLIVQDGVYTWDGPCTGETRTLTRDGAPGMNQKPDTYVWGMYHRPLGVGIREYINIPYEEFCIWADHYVCTCKVLAPVEVQAGCSKTWTRRWECVHI